MKSKRIEPARTARGAATRARIVEAATDLVRAHGVANTSLDAVLEVCHASKSQLYHYFADKDDLELGCSVNGEQVPGMALDGSFTYFTPPLPTGENLITITAQNEKGGVNTTTKKVVIQ